MDITLPPHQRKWLELEVAAGRFASVEEALTMAVMDLMRLGSDDLAWALPYVDQARQSVAKGDVCSGENYLNNLDEKIAALSKLS